MRQKNAVLVGLVATFALVSFAQAGQPARKVERHRQHRQAGRIHEGVKSGELTKDEAKKLHEEEMQVRKARKEAMKDGTVSPEERKNINKMQNKTSKDIYEEKHDEEKQPPAQ